MGRKYILIDDYDGKELPDDTNPTRLMVDATNYIVYLSEENKTALFNTLDPFIKDAEVSTAPKAAPATRAKSTGSADLAKKKLVRKWAQDNSIKFKRADGTEGMLGDRGRIPDTIMEAYDKEHAE